MRLNALVLFTLIIQLLAACAPVATKKQAAEPPLPTGVIRKGSLANNQLMMDAAVAATAQLVKLGYKFDLHRLPFRPYVLTLPTGPKGKHHWTELWVFTAKGKEVSTIVSFSENRHGGADYAIRIKS